MTRGELAAIRTAVANYMWSEGCNCCANTDAHREHEAVLAKLLRVPPYSDRSGYNFPKFRSNA